jgi:hypothetical protein
MPIGPDDVRALARATGYSVNAVKALARIYSEGGISVASGAALQEAARVLRVTKSSVAEEFRRFTTGAKQLKSITGTAKGTVSAAKEALEAKQVRSWAQEQLDATRADSAVPSRKAASMAARDAASPPSEETLRGRRRRADARLPEEARQRVETLRDLSKPEYKGGRTAKNLAPHDDAKLNRAIPQHVPEPMTEGSVMRADVDPDQLALLKGRGAPDFTSEAPAVKKTPKADASDPQYDMTSPPSSANRQFNVRQSRSRGVGSGADRVRRERTLKAEKAAERRFKADILKSSTPAERLAQFKKARVTSTPLRSAANNAHPNGAEETKMADLLNEYERERQRRLKAAGAIQQPDPRKGDRNPAHDLWSQREREKADRIAAVNRQREREYFHRVNPGAPIPEHLKEPNDAA